MKPKLSMLRMIVKCGEDSSCLDVKAKMERRVLLKLIKGRYSGISGGARQGDGVKREDRLCKKCTRNEVEDVSHWLLRCPAWNSLRQPLLPVFQSHTEDAEGMYSSPTVPCL